MPDLSVDFCGIQSPNPFWLASAPPTNTGDQVMRAFDHGWGGAVWKTLGTPITNVSSRFASVDYAGRRMMGLNNIELITDRSLDINFREMAEVKKRYPKHVVVSSLMVESKEEWHNIIQRSQDAGADALELNFGCPHGMCERGMGSAVGQEPRVLEEIARWAVEVASVPVIVKLTPNTGDINEVGIAARRAGAHAVSLINTVKSIIGVDLEKMVPFPVVGDASSNGGYCGPAVKPIALHMVGELSRDPEFRLPISGIGGIETWKDAAEFLSLGATTVQVCTAVMHHGYRIVDDMISGLEDFLRSKGMKSVNELVGKAVPQYQHWGDLDLNHHVVAEINADKCIGCQLCYQACLDGSHQCIYVPNMDESEARAKGHVAIPRKIMLGANQVDEASPLARVPWVDEAECVGCNLCAMVCPVDGCITMVEKRKAPERISWNERVA